MHNWMIVPLALCSAACCPSPRPMDQSRAPDPDRDAPHGEGQAPEGSDLLVLGAQEDLLVVLDTVRSPWSVERLGSISSLEREMRPPIESVVWLGCGTMAAGRAHTAVAAWRRDGALLGHTQLPDLATAIGDRLISYAAAHAEEYGEDARERIVNAVLPGPLVRTPGGTLAMDPVVDVVRLISEEEGCRPVEPDLRVAVALPGIESGPCETPTTAALLLDAHRAAVSEAPDPAAWRCATLVRNEAHALAPPGGRSVLDVDPEAVLRRIETTPVAEARPTGECEGCRAGSFRLRKAGSDWISDLDGQPIDGVRICRHGDEERRYVAVTPAQPMGCGPGPALYVLDGSRVVAQTGVDAELLIVGRVRLYGGALVWYVERPGEPPLPFSRVRPDVVRASRR